jgi:hypothetical protein
MFKPVYHTYPGLATSLLRVGCACFTYIFFSLQSEKNPLFSLSFALSEYCRGAPSLRGAFIRLFIYSFIHSFIRSFIHSFVHSFVYSFVRLLVCSFIRSFVHAFVRSFVSLFFRLFVRSFNHSFIYFSSFIIYQ